MTGPRLQAEHARLAYGDRLVADDLTLAIPDGRVTAIVGANASGKSTLLRSFARLMRPRSGRILLDGVDLQRRPTKEIARHLGLLPQTPTAPDGITVADLVARGRAPHQGLLRQWSLRDEQAVLEALEATRTTDLADRMVDELSGGQRQRVWIAMVLAQDTPLLLLDEPTTFLDLAHQLDVLDLVDDLNATRGTTVVMVLHDLNHAARYAHHLVAMADGRVAAAGAPADVVDAALVERVFGVRATVVADPVTGTPLVVPHARRARSLTRDVAR